jgi:hypothetical protein
MNEDDDAAGREEHVKANKAFYGWTKPDPTEEQLIEAEKARQTELRPILRPRPWWHWPG